MMHSTKLVLWLIALVLLKFFAAELGSYASPAYSVLAILGIVVRLDALDVVLFLVVLVVLGPLIASLLLLLTVVPFLEARIYGTGRDYLDSVSAVLVNQCPTAAIHGLVVMAEQVSFEDFKASFTATYLKNDGSDKNPFARLQERCVVRRWLWPYWVTSGTNTFTAQAHFHHHSSPVDYDALRSNIAEIMTETLDFTMSPWEVHIWTDYSPKYEGRRTTAVVLKCHHCVMDGFTGLRFMLSGCHPNRPPTKSGTPHNQKKKKPVTEILMSIFLAFVTGLRALLKLIVLSPDPPSPMKATDMITPETAKFSVAWHTMHQSVSDVKVAGREELAGASINDVLLTILAGGIQRFGAAKSSSDAGNRSKNLMPPSLQAVMWVSLNPLKHVYTSLKELPLIWGNAGLGACYLNLPTTPMPGTKCLKMIQEQVQVLLKSPEPLIANRMMGIFGTMPSMICAPIWKETSNKVSISMSNMPGPQFATSWCGASVEFMLFFVPPTGTVSTFVTIATYNGKISTGMTGDATIMQKEDIQTLVEKHFQGALDELVCRQK